MKRWGWVVVGLMGCSGAPTPLIDQPLVLEDAAQESPDADMPDVSPITDATPEAAAPPDAGPSPPVLPPGCDALADCECAGPAGCHDVPPKDAAAPPPAPAYDAGPTFPADGCVMRPEDVAVCADSGVGAPGPFYYLCAFGTVLPTAKCLVHDTFRAPDGGGSGEAVCCP